MRKKHWDIIAVFILSISLLTACQTALVDQGPALSNEKEDAEKEDNQQSNGQNASDETDKATSPDQENETDETLEDEVEAGTEIEAENDSKNPTSEETDVQAKRYKVNSKNYRIYSADPEASETNEENEADEEKIVLLTFDDTPTAEATYQILDILDKYKAKALFFVNGHYAEPNLDTLLEIKNRGHLIGNHTWWHI